MGRPAVFLSVCFVRQIDEKLSVFARLLCVLLHKTVLQVCKKSKNRVESSASVLTMTGILLKIVVLWEIIVNRRYAFR